MTRTTADLELAAISVHHCHHDQNLRRSGTRVPSQHHPIQVLQALHNTTNMGREREREGGGTIEKVAEAGAAGGKDGGGKGRVDAVEGEGATREKGSQRDLFPENKWRKKKYWVGDRREE